MNKLIVLVVSIGLVLSATSGLAQDVKGAQALMKPAQPTQPEYLLAKADAPTPAPVVQPAQTETETNLPSVLTKQTSKVSYSIKSRGWLQNARTGERVYEVVTLRERGLWGNGCLTQLLVNEDGQPVAVLNSSASAGPGIAIIQGASFVGGMYLFAEHLRPPKQNVNSGNSNSGNSGTGSGNGTTVNNNLSATAEGGAGGAGGLGGSATATGGTATGGTATSTATGGAVDVSGNISAGTIQQVSGNNNFRNNP